jgi:AAA+ superfamily predicted ATPase
MPVESPLQGEVAAEDLLDELRAALGRLDELLRIAIERARAAFGAGAETDPHRGLYVDDDEAARLLARAPAAPLFGSGDAPSLAPLDGAGSGFGRLADVLDLDSFDLDVVVIALAPELDLRYERLYAYLQDDVTRRRPTVDLALHLLCASAEERVASRARFAPHAPLMRHAVVELVAEPGLAEPPLIARAVKLDERIVRYLLGHDGADGRLDGVCRRVIPEMTLDELDLAPETARLLFSLGERLRDEREPLRLVFDGPPGVGKRPAAAALARIAGGRLLTFDIGAALGAELPFPRLLQLALRDARLDDAVLYLSGIERLRGDEHAADDAALSNALVEHEGAVIVARSSQAATGAPAVEPLPRFTTVRFALPARPVRRARWSAALAAARIELPEEDIDALADRFRLTPEQIVDAAGAVPHEALRAGGGAPTGDHVFAAARERSRVGLEGLGHRIRPHYGWDDIVLPEDRRRQLEEIVNHVRYRARVYDDWGFDRKLALGKGLNVLFAGPSGTGKTMAAEIVAGELGLDLYKIDLSATVSKYIGETEKNLARVFAAAERANAILFFDEADALFGKRSEVRDAHDRYANIEIGYLLQRMEEYDGVAVLATNLRRNMDDAFVRRMHVTVEFPLPDEEDRRRIWDAIWPSATPRHADLDVAALASRFELSGGHIRNIALAAAFLAAADGEVVTLDHVMRATRREYQKIGKVLLDGELDQPVKREEPE